jgi:pimeloyl-ACP methyl ester carboxylesterase
MPLVDARPFLFHTWRTLMTRSANAVRGATVRANGIDIHYLELGSGTPLLVINNGMVSTNAIWAQLPFAFNAHFDDLAEHFRLIVPDARAAGRTIHPGGPIPYDLLVDDIAALIAALDLDRPAVCGFSEGGTIATILGVRYPDAVGAIVNLDGHDALCADPNAPSYVTTRHMLGGAPDATSADPDGARRTTPPLASMFELMEADHDAAQGPGHWRTVVDLTFARVSQPSGYTVDDLGKVTAPTLLLCGDRSPFCSVEEGLAAYRELPDGEFGVLPNTGHEINRAAVAATIEFVERRLSR